MKRKPESTGELPAVPTGELSVLEPPRRRRAGAGAAQRANRSRAAQRAVDRRSARIAREQRTEGRGRTKTQSVPRPPHVSLVQRVRAMPFAVPVIGLVALGLIATLWLSTRAAQDSYDLTVAKAQHQSLVDKRDALKRTYESGDSAPELADKAARLGMVPARGAARLIVGENGRVTVRGTPAPVTGRAPRSINPKPADDALRHIDTAKVEDSTGLPGTGAPAEQSAPQATGPQQPAEQSTTGPAPEQAAPNVLPPTDAASRGAPRANPRSNSQRRE